MAATVLNSTQVHLLQMFQVDDSQQGLEELKELLYSYYSKKMDESLNELWDSGVLDQKRLDESIIWICQSEYGNAQIDH